MSGTQRFDSICIEVTKEPSYMVFFMEQAKEEVEIFKFLVWFLILPTISLL